MSRDSSKLDMLRLQAAEAVKKGDYPQAANLISKILVKQPDDPVRLQRAAAYCETGEFGAAVADLGRVLAANPGEIKAWMLRGAVRNTMGDFAKAIPDFEAALKIEPDDVKAKEGLARAKAGVLEASQQDSGEKKTMGTWWHSGLEREQEPTLESVARKAAGAAMIVRIDPALWPPGVRGRFEVEFGQVKESAEWADNDPNPEV